MSFTWLSHHNPDISIVKLNIFELIRTLNVLTTSAICIVYSKLKDSSQTKNEIKSWTDFVNVPKTIDAVRKVILQDRPVRLRLGISIRSILYKHLSLEKIFSSWIHKICQLLKKTRVVWSKEMLKKIRSQCFEMSPWYCRFRWMRAKQQSKLWVFQDEPKTTKVVPAWSNSKQMMTCFSEKQYLPQPLHWNAEKSVLSGT